MLLKIVAKHANGCNFAGHDLSPEKYGERLNTLKGFCDILGRDFAKVQKSLYTDVIIGKGKGKVTNQLKRLIRDHMFRTTLTQTIRRPRRTQSYIARMLTESSSAIVGTSLECIEKIHKYIDQGVTYFMLRFPYTEDLKSLEYFSENVVPAFKTKSRQPQCNKMANSQFLTNKS